jgi:16S rRNA (cytosine1402-N4)-methyltransferase
MARRDTRATEGVRRGTMRHVPVLLPQVLRALDPKAGNTFIDGTFGAGGYSTAILEAAPDARVLAIDRDPAALAAGAGLADAFQGRLVLCQGRFGDLDRLAETGGFAPADGVVLDIGVSSMQLDDPARGFSFQSDGPLDMRMSSDGPTAADIVNGAEEALLADILYHLGEERSARGIARAILRRRTEHPFAHTREMADLVARVLGREKIAGRHAATRTFQALRIYVNDELGELARGLVAAERILKPGGRLVVVSFHSLEDALIKHFFRDRAIPEAPGSRHLPPSSRQQRAPSFHLDSQRPISPTQDEVDANPRARSAKLRAGIRTEAAAWPEGQAEPGFPRL